MFPHVAADPLLSISKSEYPSNTTDRIVWTYRGWDRFERSHGGPDIVDFDLSSLQGAASFSSRKDILAELQRLLEGIDDSVGYAEFLRARLGASITYLRALMGQQDPFTEYVKDTLGLEPQPFSSHEVENARHLANQRLAHFDLEMKAELRARFDAQFVLSDPEKIKDGIIGNQNIWLARLREAGIPVPEQLNFKVEFAEVDAYWSNWISGSLEGGITLRINIHPRKKYDYGRPLALCLHEICGHAVHMSIWRDLIASNNLDQACGVTTVHSPEMFVSEGLGQTVSDLLGGDENFPFEFQASRALQYYTLVILHNAHLMVYSGTPIDTVIEYACDNLPFSESDVITADLRDRGTNPLFRTYLLSYTSAEREIRRLIYGLTVRQKQRLFLAMYTRPLTPTQLLQVGADLADL